MIHPDLQNAWTVSNGVNVMQPVFGGLFSVPLVGYQGHVSPVIIAVWLMCQIEKRLHKVVPEMCIRDRCRTGGPCAGQRQRGRCLRCGLGGGSHTSGHLVALVLQVQVDLGAHHLRHFDLSLQLAVGVLCHERGLVVDIQMCIRDSFGSC